MFHRLLYVIPLVVLILAIGHPAPVRANDAPVISPQVVGTLGDNGWYVSDVTVSWKINGKSSSDCATTTIVADTTGTTLTCAVGTTSQSITIRRDATAPVAIQEYVLPNPVLLNDGADAGVVQWAENFSGIASQRCDSVDTSSAGPHTVTCTATDYAGNVGRTSVGYSVIYNFEGFLTPVDNPPALNIAKAGHVIPLKWRLTDVNGVAVTKLSSSVVKVTLATQSCNLTGSPDVIEEYAAGQSGLLRLGGALTSSIGPCRRATPILVGR